MNETPLSSKARTEKMNARVTGEREKTKENFFKSFKGMITETKAGMDKMLKSNPKIPGAEAYNAKLAEAQAIADKFSRASERVDDILSKVGTAESMNGKKFNYGEQTSPINKLQEEFGKVIFEAQKLKPKEGKQ